MEDVEHSSVPELAVRSESDGQSVRVDMMLDEKSVSRLWLTPFVLQIGEARVLMEGVGGVGTDDAHRNRGYSRQVLEAALKHMEGGKSAISMLYGIRDFYQKFGYVTAGPDHLVVLTDLQRDSTLPAGWTVRPFVPHDFDAVKALYDRQSARGVGAAIRPVNGPVWTRLLRSRSGSRNDECRVVTDANGVVRGYLWRARWCWYVQYTLEPDFKQALVLGEVIADRSTAADAVLAAGRKWAQEPARGKRKEVVFASPPDSLVSEAAMRQDSRIFGQFSAAGGSMARVLNVRRLIESLCPEFEARLRSACSEYSGWLEFRTDIGTATIRVDSDRVHAAAVPAGAPCLTISLPQTELARLALGAFAPRDILARLTELPEGATTELIVRLFPRRYPHMYLPDRY